MKISREWMFRYYSVRRAYRAFIRPVKALFREFNSERYGREYDEIVKNFPVGAKVVYVYEHDPEFKISVAPQVQKLGLFPTKKLHDAWSAEVIRSELQIGTPGHSFLEQRDTFVIVEHYTTREMFIQNKIYYGDRKMIHTVHVLVKPLKPDDITWPKDTGFGVNVICANADETMKVVG